jgi:hypothetical protein
MLWVTRWQMVFGLYGLADVKNWDSLPTGYLVHLSAKIRSWEMQSKSIKHKPDNANQCNIMRYSLDIHLDIFNDIHSFHLFRLYLVSSDQILTQISWIIGFPGRTKGCHAATWGWMGSFFRGCFQVVLKMGTSQGSQMLHVRQKIC